MAEKGTGMRGCTAVVVLAGVLAACTAGGGDVAAPGAGSGEVQPSDVFTSDVAGDVEKCGQVKVALGEAAPSETGSDQLRLPLTMTNTGEGACVLRGFPGASLRGRDGETWDLTRSGDAVKDVRLAPGGTTTSYLTFLPAKDGWDVTSVVITPPNTTDSQDFEWPGGPVVRQDAATHPGTFISPVGAWGSGGA